MSIVGSDCEPGGEKSPFAESGPEKQGSAIADRATEQAMSLGHNHAISTVR